MLAATVTISVFGLFHPRELIIQPWETARVQIACGASKRMIEGRAARVPIRNGCVASSSAGGETDFILIVPPNRIRRHYRGTLRVIRNGGGGELVPVITMSLESAVASVVAAEAPGGAPEIMQQVQAILSRSFFTAAHIPRHKYSGFCDTTHCQYIKDPPAAKSQADLAARSTEGKVVWYNDRIVPTYYAARCNDRLAPLPASAVNPGDYPYFPVRCDYCRRNPDRAAQRSSARPHNHGLCQMGALDLANQGLSALQIIVRYFPGTEVRVSR